MRNRIWFFLLSLISNFSVSAQSFTGRTNEVILDFNSSTINSVLPKINWINPRLEFSSSQNNSVIIEAVISSSTPLTGVTLQVIDEVKNIREKKFTLEPKSNSYLVNQTIRLEDGQYQIKIIADNETGGSILSNRSIIIGRDAIADAVSMDRKDYAILFATDKYEFWNDLVNPIFDANTISQELRENYNFEVEVVENPTQEDVFIKIAEYAQRTYKSQDQLFIFFAGHGYFDDTFGEGFVVASNSLENDPAKTSYISHSRLRTVINNIPCEHILLTMDVCFGGTFDPLIAKERGTEHQLTNENDFLARKLSYKTRKYLTSGGKTYVSDGVSGKHSPFALRFLQALKDGGGSDRVLTLSEIKLHVEKLVPEPRYGGFGDDHIASDFVFVPKNR